MLIELVTGGSAIVVSGTVGYILAKKSEQDKYNIYVEQAKAKAKAIENEASLILENSKLKVKEASIEAREEFERKLSQVKYDYDVKSEKLAKKEESLKQMFQDELKGISEEKREIKKEVDSLKASKHYLESLKKEYQSKQDEAMKLIESHARLTLEEAKELVLKRAEEESRIEIAHVVRKYEEEAKKEGKKRADYILAQATTRFAGEFAAERLINPVTLPNDEIKGRIIGKDGRNIKKLEMLLGVDILIDDTPNTITLSSFNLYRRAVATKTIETLIDDGRIQPARIEEVFEKVQGEFEEKIYEEGENITIDLGLGILPTEITKLIGKLKFRASYGQNALAHSLEVANLSGIIAAEMGGDAILARRAGLLHDIGKSLTHEYQGSHVDLGGELCKRHNEPDEVINAIYAHHGHEEARSVEAAAVCAADTLSAARPGARREVLESFLKRVESLENIAKTKRGVRQAYAINAGREIRVIVNASMIDDDESVLLSKEIAKEIEKEVQYPGEIKVMVVRESRAIEFAK